MALDAHPARRANVTLHYDGTDISADLAPYLIGFTYTENASDQADDIAVVLEDREGRWRGAWFPDKGSTLTAAIVTHEWNGPNASWAMPCGVFQIDQIECSGKPTQVTIKAVSTLTKTHMRQERSTRTWENVFLSSIARDIAKKCGLTLFWDSETDPLLEVRTQVETSNLSFIQSLCRDYGLGVKVADEQLIIYDEEEWEARPASGSIAFDDGRVEKYSFTSKTNDTYKQAHLQYHDPVKDETFSVYASDDVEGTERILEMNQKADSPTDARRMAEKRLHDRNKREMTGSVTLMGSMGFSAGDNVEISGWGNFDGKWTIEKVTHSIGRRGAYTTKLDLRMGGSEKKAKASAKAASGGGAAPADEGFDVYGK